MKSLQELVDAHFLLMCEQGNLEQVKHWLTSPEVEIHANIHTNNDLAIVSACSMGHLDVVKYLLTSPDLVEHCDIHTDHDMPFRFAYALYSIPTSQTKKVIDYLILEYGIKFTDRIKNELKSFPNQEVSKMFLKRTLTIIDGERDAVRDSFYCKLHIVK